MENLFDAITCVLENNGTLNCQDGNCFYRTTQRSKSELNDNSSKPNEETQTSPLEPRHINSAQLLIISIDRGNLLFSLLDWSSLLVYLERPLSVLSVKQGLDLLQL